MTNQKIKPQSEKVFEKFNEVECKNLNLKKLINEINIKINENSNSKMDKTPLDELSVLMVYLKNMKVTLFERFNELLLELEEYDKQISQHLEERDIYFIEEDFADEDYDNHIIKLLEKKEESDEDDNDLPREKMEYGKPPSIIFQDLFERFQDNCKSIDLIKSSLNEELSVLEYISDKCGFVSDNETLKNVLEEELKVIPKCECYMRDLLDETVELNDTLYGLGTHFHIMKVLKEAMDETN